jgi:hypothetical protein
VVGGEERWADLGLLLDIATQRCWGPEVTGVVTCNQTFVVSADMRHPQNRTFSVSPFNKPDVTTPFSRTGN